METETVETTAVDKVFASGEENMKQQIAIKAIGLVKPLLEDCNEQISIYLGDCEKGIWITKTTKDSPVGITVLDAKGKFEIKGGGLSASGKLEFRGTKSSQLKYYTAEEFVELLLSGRLKELTEKLLK